MTDKQARILILDDDPAITEALGIALPYYGYEVKALTSHAKLFPAVVKFSPDLIIMDYFLAGEEGTKMAEQLREKAKLPKLKIIMISAHPSAKNDINPAYIDLFIAKPFDMGFLTKKIRQLTR